MAGLTEAKVLTAGADLVRARGVDALGIRPVADRLGVTPMALYRYVRDGEQLHQSVINIILADLPRCGRRGLPEDRLRDWAVETRVMLSRYPGLARHLLLHWFESEDALDVIESLLECAAAAGLHDFECVAVENAVFMYVLMRVEAEMSVRAVRIVTRSMRPVGRNPARYPLIHRYAADFTTAHLDDHFMYGLDALLAGVATTTSPR